MELDYFYKHILRTLHTVVRVYDRDLRRITYYGYDETKDALKMDMNFCRKVFHQGNEQYPVIFSEAYPICYGVIVLPESGNRVIIGPVNTASVSTLCEGMTIDEHERKKHNVLLETDLPCCEYETFCEEVLLVNYAATGRKMSFDQLNEKNYMTDELRELVKKTEYSLLFEYREGERRHNPYSRELRVSDAIAKGDESRTIEALDEVFMGQYGILSQDRLRSAKNLAIIGLAIAARASIRGGIPFERAFSIDDNYICQVDAADSIGKVRAIDREGQIAFAKMVHEMQEQIGDADRSRLTEDCKNLIFKKMHTTIRVQELAAELGVTKEYLAAQFRKTTGETVKNYISRNKVRLAENMLIYSEYNIGQIGSYLGFCSQSHFDRVFKKYNQMTPDEYRNYYKKEKE